MVAKFRLRGTLALASLLGSACSSGQSSPPPGNEAELVSIAIEPADQELLIDGDTAATSAFRAIGTFADGSSEDVTARATFHLVDPQLGSFAGGNFTSTTEHGGRTRVMAVSGAVEGSTGLTLRIRQRYTDPGSADLPADPSPLFEDTNDDPARALSMVYPTDAVLTPPNLQKLEFHFLPGAGNTVFELAFDNDMTDVRVYARCTLPMSGGCIYVPDRRVWRWIAETNRGGEDLSIRVRGTDDAGSSVGGSSKLRVAFTQEDVVGAIYYWQTVGAGGPAIMRYDFGSTEQTMAERFVGMQEAGGKCVGCHALSRDGSKVVTAVGGWDVEDMMLVDVGDKAQRGAPAKSAFESWSPDASTYVGVFAYAGSDNYNLLLFDGDTGSRIGAIDVGATAARAATHPDWSPEGDKIVYTRVGAPYEDETNNQRFYQGSIAMVEQTGASTWSPPVELIAQRAGRNHYYPSFSPGGELIAFNQSSCPSGNAHKDCNADTDPSASIYVIEPRAGAMPVELVRANQGGPRDQTTQLANSWPKWAPFEFQRTSEDGARVIWITFSSSRQYGLRPPPASNGQETDVGTLLWMTAIDPDRARSGQDPSYPAFALPFQDIASSNHIAQWAEQLVE